MMDRNQAVEEAMPWLVGTAIAGTTTVITGDCFCWVPEHHPAGCRPTVGSRARDDKLRQDPKTPLIVRHSWNRLIKHMG